MRLYPVEDHTIVKGRHVEKVIIGYGNLSEKEILTGVTRLKDFFLKKLMQPS